MSFVLVFSMTATEDEARKIADQALSKKLIACATIIRGPFSLYWWKGSIEKSSEVLLLMKTEKRLLNRLMRLIKKIHSYEVPEILAIPVVSTLPAYAKWMKSSLK